jgi:hypothetical protein
MGHSNKNLASFIQPDVRSVHHAGYLDIYFGLYDLLLQGVNPDRLGQSFLHILKSWIEMNSALNTFAREDSSPRTLTIAAPAILQIAAVAQQTPLWRIISEHINVCMVNYICECNWCCSATPLLTGQIRDISLLRSWLVEHPEEQERLRRCLNHRLFSLVMWGGLVSFVVMLQHKHKGRSRLLGCQVPCAAAAASAAAAAAAANVGSLRASSAAAGCAESSWLQSQLLCLGFTSAPEVLKYSSTLPLETYLISCLFYSYMLTPLDRLLRLNIELQSRGEHASSSSSSCGTVGDGGSSGGSNPNSSGTSANNGTTGAGKDNSSSSSSWSAWRATQQAKPSAASVAATPSAVGSESHGKGRWQWPFELKKGFFSLASTLASKTLNALSGLKKGFFAFEAEVQGVPDFDGLPECPLIVQQLVDWLFAPGVETLANTAAAAAAAVPLAGRGVASGSIEARGNVVASEGTAGPVMPTAQHLGLILELLLLAWPTDGSSDGTHRTKTQQQDQQQGGKDKEEGLDKKQQPQQGKLASCPADELSWPSALERLLLLAALLQQATTAEKQQFLMEQGSHLLQLLYHLLLEAPRIGGKGKGKVRVLVYEGPWGQTLAEARAGKRVDELAGINASTFYSVRKLVMLVFQALMFEPVSWSGATAEALVGQARMVFTNAGGFGTCDIAGKMQEVATFC